MKPVPSTSSTRMPLRGLAVDAAHGRAALAALVGALVLGILGMHGLASHGTPAAHAAPSRTLSAADTPSDHDAAMSAAESHAGHTHPAASATTQDAAIDPGAISSSRQGMNDMVMLCVVMLAAAALTLLVRLAGVPFRPLLPAAFEPASVRERVLQWVRGTGPPPVWAFSVIRC